MSDHDLVEGEPGVVRRHRARQMVRDVFVVAVLVAVVVVAMDNRDKVRVGYAVGDAKAPIWTVIVIATVAGMIIGWLMRHRPRRRV